MLPSLGTLKGLGSGAYNLGRGALFMGASEGAGLGGKTMNALGHVAPLAPSVAGSFKATSQQPGFKPQSTVKTSEDSPSEKKPSLLHSVAEGAGYGALAGTPFGYLSGAVAANQANRMHHDNTALHRGLSYQEGAHDAFKMERGEDRKSRAPSAELAEWLMVHKHPGMSELLPHAGIDPYAPVRNLPGQTLAPVVGGAVLGGLAGGACHLWNGHKKEAVSKDWILQRVEQAAGNGATAERLKDFAKRQEQNGASATDKLRFNKDFPHWDEIQRATDMSVKYRNAALRAAKLVPKEEFKDTATTAAKLIVKDDHKLVTKSEFSPALKALMILSAAALIAGGYALTKRDRKEEKTTSLHPVVEKAIRTKVAFDWHRPVNALSYAAFAAPYLSKRVHDNEKLTTALNTAGLIGLGTTSADHLAHGDPTAAYDLAGLGLMGAGLVHGALRPSTASGH